MQAADLQVIKEIPGFKVILKAVLKSQIQQLVRLSLSLRGLFRNIFGDNSAIFFLISP